MKYILNKISHFPKISLFLILIITVAFIQIIKKNLRMETDLDEYMPKDNPAFVYSEKAEKWFDIKDGIIIAIENEDGIYGSKTLEKIKNLTRELQQLEQIEKDDVTSLYTADNIVGTEFGLDVKSFYKKVPTSDSTLLQLQKHVRTNEMVYKRLISENEEIALIIANIEDDVFSQAFYQQILDIVEKYENPEKLYVAGRPIVEGTMAYLAPRDMRKMVPIVILVIILVLYGILRSVRNTIFTLLVVLFSTIWAFGLMAAFNIPIYAVSTMIPVMLIAIGVADGIHLYSHLNLYLTEHPDASKTDAVKEMLRSMWKPVVMTSVTTAVGFISLLTSQVYPIKYFGLFTAFGVLMAMVFSLVLIPAGLMTFGLSRGKNKKTEETESQGGFFFTLAENVLKYKWWIMGITVVFIGLSIIGITKVWINSSFLAKFEEDSEIVQTDEFINQHFGGTSTLNVILESDEKDTFKKPVINRLVDQMQTEVEQIDVVGNSFGLTDYLKRMNKVMHADSIKYDRIPNSNELIAQYLLLYEMSGDPDNLWKVVDYDYGKTNITFQLKSDNSKAIKKVIAVIEKFEDVFQEKGIKLNYAGSGYKALVFTDLILNGQISSLLLALIIVIILLSFMFKKITVGFIGAIPITITAIIGFGIMGLANIPLSTTTALVSSIAIGIGIDYAVHFIERYKIYAHQTNDKKLTTKLTMYHSGRAIIFNALVVIAGFLVLLFSVFPPNRALGALVSLNMFTSFLGTVTIMFILLYLSNIYFKKSK